MLSVGPNLSMLRKLLCLVTLLGLAFVGGPAFSPSFVGARAQAPTSADILPLSQVHAGMQGYAYTIFAGDQVEKFDLEVLGVMPDFLGPKQSIILVQLKGPKVEHTGVVAGMSGSPVYLDGKLAGALSLKLGVFTKEPIGGVTPIEDVLRPQPQLSTTLIPEAPAPEPHSLSQNAAVQNELPSGSALEPIETPLIFSGYQPEALHAFASQLQSFGFVAAQGGTAAPKSGDAHLVPGDMAGMVLVQGDTSVSSACTVTAVRSNQVYLCGHPFLSLGDVQFPMARTEVVTTLSSDLSSTKIINVGGDIGTITGDHLTAVTGKLGAPPPMIPLDLTLTVAGAEKKLHFEMVDHAKLTPLLMGLTVFNGLTQNSLYGEGTTLHLSGQILVHGHAPVQIENTFAPGDAFAPDGLPIALAIQNVFTRLFTNTHEIPVFDRIALHVESIPGRQSYTIESAWLEKGEAAPGESLRVRVLLRPYRGPARIEETTVRVPEQATRGTTLRILVTDGDLLNRASRGFSFSTADGSFTSLDQLIALLNQERRNDRLYVGLFAPTPTILWDDKELPNVPLSEINVVDGRPTPGSVQVLRESLASESSIPLRGPVTGIISLNLQIR